MTSNNIIRYQSEEEYMRALEYAVKNFDTDFSNIKPDFTLREVSGPLHYAKTILQTIDYVIIKDVSNQFNDIHDRVYFYDYDKQEYNESVEIIEHSIEKVNIFTNGRHKVSFRNFIHHFCANYDLNQSHIPIIQLLDTRKFINFKNGLLDRETYQLIDNNDVFSFQLPTFNYLSFDKTNSYLLKFIDEMFDNWSGCDNDKKIILKQIMLCALMGESCRAGKRNKVAIILSGGIGHGKTTFLKICQFLANDKYAEIDMRNLRKSNIKHFRYDTRLLTADDASTHKELSFQMALNLSALIETYSSFLHRLSESESDNVNRIFYKEGIIEASKYIKIDPLLIMTTSEEIEFQKDHEFLPMKFAEIKMNDLATIDDIFKKKLKNFIEHNDQEFYENLIHYLLDDMPIFNEFHKYFYFGLNGTHYLV